MRYFLRAIGIVFITHLCASNIHAQDYKNAIGIRGGFQNGITYKTPFNEKLKFEGILGTRWGGWSVTGLLEKYEPAFDKAGLFWYYGAGAHIGLWDRDAPGFDNDGTTVLGVDGIVGLEYNIKEIPFNLSLDWKPAFNLIGHQGLWFDNTALSIRYTF